MREKLDKDCSSFFFDGITPACAGKTNFKDIFLFNGWDHPRVCGKNLLTRRTRNSCPGSPPRVREKPFLNVSDGRNGGITPACAGKTASLNLKLKRPEDHPRVCGKNPRGSSVSVPEGGSPPRVREKRWVAFTNR